MVATVPLQKIRPAESFAADLSRQDVSMWICKVDCERAYIADKALAQGVGGYVSLEVFGARVPPQTVGTLVQARVGSMALWYGA